jgi:RimJ/RimL family protein N-acetyltransferase
LGEFWRKKQAACSVASTAANARMKLFAVQYVAIIEAPPGVDHTSTGLNMETSSTKQEVDEYVAPLLNDLPPPPPVALVPPMMVNHGAELRDIVKLPQVMTWVAKGQTWRKQNLEKFFVYCAEEETQPDAERENYYHVVTETGRCVGVVGIHPITYDRRARGKVFLIIFLSPLVSGRGVGTKAIAGALADYWARYPDATVYVDIRTDNFPMLRVAEKLALKRVGAHRIGRKSYFRFAARR